MGQVWDRMDGCDAMRSLTRKAASGALLGHAQQGMIRESPVLVMCLDSVFLLVWIALAIGEPHVESLSILQSYTSRHTKTRNEASFELSERILCARPAAIRDLLLRQKRPTIAAEETYY
jgi:hypothetical protein